MRLTIDFETRSRIDLVKQGVYVYAEHESTDILCCAVKIDDSPIELWIPKHVRESFGREHFALISDPALAQITNQANEIHAHNAQFERLLWKHVMTRYGFKDVPLEKWRCTAAKAASYALPRSLGEACEVLDLPQQKDKFGYQIMTKMCKPIPKGRKLAGQWHEDPDDFAKLCQYCVQDVEAEYALDQALYDMPQSELEVWRMDQRLNDRGILIDLDSVNVIMERVKEYENRLLVELQEITRGKLRSTRQVQATIDLLKLYGLDLSDLTKRTVEKVMAGEIDPTARRVLEIRQALGKSSVSKYEAMQRCACKDGRVRGTLLYHGAGTGRWSGKMLQTQNFPRGSLNDDNMPLASEAGLFMLTQGDLDDVVVSYGCPMEVASSVLRNVMIAGPGKVFAVGDFSQIEARVLAWLAGEQAVLDAFASGRDLYKVAAADIFATVYEAVDKSQRQVGKTAELALGYQGGIGAFAKMAETYGVDLEKMIEPVMDRADYEQIEFAQRVAAGYFDKAKRQGITPEITFEQAVACDIVKQKWRARRQRIVAFWAGLEEAAVRTVRDGTPYSYGGVKFGIRGNFLHMRLPSGRLLAYYKPDVRPVKTPWGELKDVVTAMNADSTTKKWVRRPYYGGLWAENVTQATARDVLVEAMLELERNGFALVLSVHDEAGAEVSEENPRLDLFKEIMARVPSWACGLPVGADCWVGKRYRKA